MDSHCKIDAIYVSSIIATLTTNSLEAALTLMLPYDDGELLFAVLTMFLSPTQDGLL